MNLTVEHIAELLNVAELDEFDQEDAHNIIAVMLEAFTPLQAMTWLLFYDHELDGIPLAIIRDGRVREVLAVARKLVVEAS